MPPLFFMAKKTQKIHIMLVMTNQKIKNIAFN